MIDWHKIERSISEATGTPFQVQHREALGGGCINTAFRINDQQRQFFIKINDKQCLDMFIAESTALSEIHSTQTVKVPLPLCYGTCGTHSFLVMAFIPFSNAKNDPGPQQRLAQQLAAMHHHQQPKFGWQRHNTIGTTPQINTWTDTWVEFYRQHRLQYQLNLAINNGYGSKLGSLGDLLLANLELFFADYSPSASLLHGDLWAGNTAVNNEQEPVIYDPASYYGDRECDIAMTELFGGFSQEFYAAYHETWPLDEGYQVRKTLYNLYHILNHLNLFGGGYENQAISMIQSLTAEIR